MSRNDLTRIHALLVSQKLHLDWSAADCACVHAVIDWVQSQHQLTAVRPSCVTGLSAAVATGVPMPSLGLYGAA
jgi:hypothetical protein